MAAEMIPAAPVNLASYSKILVMFSGGKDSIACLLYLLELGVPKNKIELWHHDVDGREGSKLMDWACTRDYCRKLAQAFGIPIYFSWKKGGFEGEMNRQNSLTAPICFEMPVSENTSVTLEVGGTRGKQSTRLKFPAQSADLSSRWCSAYLKIDVGAVALRNQLRFSNSRTLVVTGERAQESTARSKYPEFEIHRSDNRSGKMARHVDHWRPVHSWSEEQVWGIMKRFGVNPHPAYKLGWGRVSCAACIFGNASQWASLKLIDPEKVEKIAQYEEQFDHTIKKGETVRQQANKGQPYETMSPEAIRQALKENYDEPVIIPQDQWVLPAGAFKECGGPI